MFDSNRIEYSFACGAIYKWAPKIRALRTFLESEFIVYCAAWSNLLVKHFIEVVFLCIQKQITEYFHC